MKTIIKKKITIKRPPKKAVAKAVSEAVRRYNKALVRLGRT